MDRIETWVSEGDVQGFLDAGLMLDLHLATATLAELRPEAFQAIEETVRAMDRIAWTQDEREIAYGTHSIPASVHTNAIRDIIATTAALCAHEATGSTQVTMAEVGRAIARLEACVASMGLGRIVRLYATVVALADHTAVAFYAPMPVTDLLSGRLHRPQARDDILEQELAISLGVGTMAVREVDGVPCVVQTDLGRQRMAAYRRDLGASGFIAAHKSAMIAIEMSRWDIEQAIAEGTGDLSGLRRRFIHLVRIAPGSSVLDCGAAAGVNIFEGGLLTAVGPTGRIVALDPAAAMITRLQSRARKAGYDRVEAVVAGVEAIPFPDATFDVVFGTFFLLFVDVEKGIGEMLRVLRPGGTIAFCELCAIDYNDFPWYRDWFLPAFTLAERFGVSPSRRALAAGTVATVLRQWGADVQEVVGDHLVSRAVSPERFLQWMKATDAFGVVTDLLPWKAREAFWEEVTERGKRVCAEVPSSERIIPWPVEMVRGIKA